MIVEGTVDMEAGQGPTKFRIEAWWTEETQSADSNTTIFDGDPSLELRNAVEAFRFMAEAAVTPDGTT